MARVLLLKLKKCFSPFTMLPVEVLSETGFFRYLSNDVLQSRLFPKYISYGGHLCFKMFKI